MKSLKVVIALTWLLFGGHASFAISPPAAPAPQPQPAAAKPAPKSSKVLELDWDELVPKEERQQYTFQPPPPPNHYLDESGPGAVQSGSSAVNKELNGMMVKIAGFIVPLEMTNKGVVPEFLLVPYFGACIHVPPPPPNQIIHVRMKKGISLNSIYDPQWITGRLRTSVTQSKLASAAYTLEGEKAEIYSY